jgi:hypothetical protein
VTRASSSRAFAVSRSVVRDLAEVQVEDVEPVALGRRAEVDVATETPCAHERGVESFESHVRRPDEEDLGAIRLCLWQS